MANVPLSYLPKFVPGFRLIDGSDINKIVTYLNNSITPSTSLIQAGSSLITANNALFAEQGNLVNGKVVGNPIKGNLADTTDDILFGIVLPANFFDVAGRVLQITFQGMLAANGNNKRIKFWANPTMAGQTVSALGVISGGTVSAVGTGVLLADSGVQTGNAVGWQISTTLAKIGVAGSNTQFSQSTPIFGVTHGGITAALFPTQPENAAMNLVVTGSSPTTGAANDVLLQFIEHNLSN